MSHFNEKMLRIYNDYLSETGRDSAELNSLYEFAVEHELWDYNPSPSSKRRQFIEQMTRVLKEQTVKDSDGVEVRAKFAVVTEKNGELFSEWGDIRSWPKEKLINSFQSQRKGIVADCYKLYRAVKYFNENRSKGNPFQLELDFSIDVKERDIEETIRKSISGMGKRLTSQSQSNSNKTNSTDSRASI